MTSRARVASLNSTLMTHRQENLGSIRDVMRVFERGFVYSGHNNVRTTRLSTRLCRRSNRFRDVAAVALLLSSSSLLQAEDDVQFQSQSSLDPAQPKSVITERFDSPDLKLGKGDWVVRGPIVDSLRQQQPAETESLGRRILNLPIIRLFVPKPTPPPSETEVYSVDGKSSRPWAVIASGARRSHGSPDNPLFLEGGCALISIGR